MSDKIREALEEMVTMMDSGDEPGSGSKWHTKAKAALDQQPAPVAVPDGLRVQVCKLGRYGAAYDPAGTHYAYSHADQPDNDDAMKLGRAAAKNANKSHFDEIDRGAHLLQTLQAEGFGVFQIAAAPAAPVAVGQEPVAWDVFYDDDDRLAHTVRTKVEADRYASMAYYVKPLYYTAPPAAEQPTPQQVSDYLHGLDAIQRGLVEREHLAAAEQPDAVKVRRELLDWAVGRWQAEVSLRPLVSIHRRILDNTWRQVILRLGGDPDVLLGPDHDTLLLLAGGDK